MITINYYFSIVFFMYLCITFDLTNSTSFELSYKVHNIIHIIQSTIELSVRNYCFIYSQNTNFVFYFRLCTNSQLNEQFYREIGVALKLKKKLIF